MTQIPDKLYYRPDEAAKQIGVHVETIRRWIREEKLQSTRTLGGHHRIPIKEIMRLKLPACVPKYHNMWP